MNCDDIYQSVLDITAGDGYNLFKLAQCFIDGYDPAKLRAMLDSADNGIVSDGLFVLGEIGPLAKSYFAEILNLTRSPDADLRAQAEKLASIYVAKEL
jgi:hypothetical protein